MNVILIPIFCLTLAQLSAADSPHPYFTRTDPSASGTLRGSVLTDEPIEHVIAFESRDIRAYRAELDPSTGSFVFRHLPPGVYDLMIKTQGHLYEGLSLNPPLEEAGDTSEARRLMPAIAARLLESDAYFNKKSVSRLVVTRSGRSARLLVVQWRDKPDYLAPSEAEIVRRVDFVELERQGDVWRVIAARHLLRESLPAQGPDAKMDTTYLRGLGGVVVGESEVSLNGLDLARLEAEPRGRFASSDELRVPGR